MDPRTYAREFRDFLFKTSAFGMALGVVMGGAVGKLVDSLVKDLIMPVVGVLTPSGLWHHVRISFWRLNFTVGSFLGALVDFVIIAAVVFTITRLFMKGPPTPPTKPCPRCREAIHPEATRCRYCTSDVAAA